METTCTIISIDQTIISSKSEKQQIEAKKKIAGKYPKRLYQTFAETSEAEVESELFKFNVF